MMFKLHEQLKRDCILVGEFPLSQLLLMNDAQYPWFILVPQRNNISEIYQLSDEDQQLLFHESVYLSKVLMKTYHGDKMNTAALGNVVPQLHVHHVVRYKNDVAWPAPVWGVRSAQPYSAATLHQRLGLLRESLVGGDFRFNL